MCDVKALPRNFKVQFFVVDGTQGFAISIDSFVVEISVRHWEGLTGYDGAEDRALVNVGITHDTAEFAVTSIRRWWQMWEERLILKRPVC